MEVMHFLCFDIYVYMQALLAANVVVKINIYPGPMHETFPIDGLHK